MPENPMLWIISPAGAVETFFPCEQGAEPAVPPGYVLSRVAPARAADVPFLPPPISLAEIISAFTPSEFSAAIQRPGLLQALMTKIGESIEVNPESERMREMLEAAGMSSARVAEILSIPRG
jgi:hypothetical protein